MVVMHSHVPIGTKEQAWNSLVSRITTLRQIEHRREVDDDAGGALLLVDDAGVENLAGAAEA